VSTTPERDAGAARLPGVRVLVVDDSEINLEVARKILESQGATVSECVNGELAVARLRAQPDHFDLVLMDIQMPVMDGNEATRRVRTELGLTRLPIIALTAGALVAERQRTLDAGMNAFLSKPLDPPTLIETVRHHVELARGERIPSAARPAASAASPVADDWPRIDGIDEADAALRFGGDVALFLSMLQRFTTEFADLVVAPSLDTPGLLARLHKLRGSAGALGATRVHQLATRAEAELELAPDSEHAAPLLCDLATALSSVTTHARPALAAHASASTSSSAASASAAAAAASADPGAAARDLALSVRALGDLLAQQDLAAIDCARQLAPALGVAWGDTDARALTDAVERLDFSHATALLAAHLPDDHRATG
jgi:CheY-like chemotaxis protein